MPSLFLRPTEFSVRPSTNRNTGGGKTLVGWLFEPVEKNEFRRGLSFRQKLEETSKKSFVLFVFSVRTWFVHANKTSAPIFKDPSVRPSGWKRRQKKDRKEIKRNIFTAKNVKKNTKKRINFDAVEKSERPIVRYIFCTKSKSSKISQIMIRDNANIEKIFDLMKCAMETFFWNFVETFDF